MASTVAPRLDQLGGGIARGEVGAKTASYESYFSEDATKNGEELTKKRLSNYTDVVNSCACLLRSSGCVRDGGVCTSLVGCLGRLCARACACAKESCAGKRGRALWRLGWRRAWPP